MKDLGTYTRPALLKDHPPVTQNVMLASTTSEQTLSAGTVLGIKDSELVAYVSDATADCILAEDVNIPADTDVAALVYVHAEVIASELVWGSAITDAQKKTALTALRGKGIYASEA